MAQTTAEKIKAIGDWSKAITEAQSLAIDENQDWENESSFFYFEDGSSVRFTPDDITAYGRRAKAHFATNAFDDLFADNMALTGTKVTMLNGIIDAYNDGADYVTYGDGDLGVPVKINDALTDIINMDPESIGDGTWYVCDETGKVAE